MNTSNDSKRSELWLSALIFAAFLPTITNGFIFDDLIHLDPDFIANTSWLDLLKTPFYPGNLYRPTLYLFLKTFSTFRCATPEILHSAIILLHITTALLLFNLLKKLSTHSVAFWATLLWAVNPTKIEAVGMISNSSEVFVLFFSLLALRSKAPYLIATFSLLAFGAKESAFAFLPLLTLFLIAKKQLPAKASYITISCALLAGLSHYYCTQTGSPSCTDNFLACLSARERLPIGASLLGTGIGQFILPLNLRFDYSAPFFSDTNPVLGVLLLSIFVLLLLYKKNGVATTFYFAGTLITSNLLFAIGTPYALRLLYLPSIGIALLFTQLCGSKLLRAGFVLIFIFSSWHYAVALKSQDTLVSYENSFQETSYRMRLNNVLYKLQKKELADLQPEITLLKAYFPEAYLAEAKLNLQQGLSPEEALIRAINLSPSFEEARFMLARYLLRQSRAAEALTILDQQSQYRKIEEQATLKAAALTAVGKPCAAKKLLSHFTSNRSTEREKLKTLLEPFPCLD